MPGPTSPLRFLQLAAATALGAGVVACGPAGSGSVPAPAVPPPAVAGAGSTLELTFTTSKGVVTDVVQATPEAAWEALRRAYGDLGIPVGEVSEASRVAGNARLVLWRRLGETPLSRYLECGAGLTGPFADRYRIEMLLRTAIVPAEGGSVRVESYLEATARNPEGSSNTGVACATTQRLEREIAERVRLHVGGAR